jgi:hypothetical protein
MGAMQGPDGKTYIAVQIGCCLFVTEASDGMTEADAIAQLRESQRRILLIAALLGIPGLRALGLHPDRVIFGEWGDGASVLTAMQERLRHASQPEGRAPWKSRTQP